MTTNTLLDHWLKEHENWWREYANPPQEIGDALKSDVFYTQAIATEGSFATYAEIPLEKPATAQRAAALLVARSPYIDEEWPDELIVSVEAQDRTFIVDAPVEAKIPAAPACDKIWRDSERQADDAYSAYSASDPKNQELPRPLHGYPRRRRRGLSQMLRSKRADQAPPRRARTPGASHSRQPAGEMMFMPPFSNIRTAHWIKVGKLT